MFGSFLSISQKKRGSKALEIGVEIATWLKSYAIAVGLGLLMILSIGLRWQNLYANIGFTSDTDRDILVAKNLVETHDWSLRFGPYANGGHYLLKSSSLY